MVLSLALGIRDVASGDYIDAAKSLFTIYSWIWYMLYFGLTSMFIGFKAVQLIRDEIDDGTLLIFSSIPISRTRMIIEKWLALQLLCLIYSLIILLLSPILSFGMGQKGTAFGKIILSKVNFMILTSFILQLFLTTIGILISLGLNAKGVIGILFTIGFLTVIGAMIPFIYNASKGDRASQYLIKTADLAKNPVKFKDSDLKKTYDDLLNPTGWPVWSVSDDKLSISFSYNSENMEAFDVTSLAQNIDLVVTKLPTTGNPISWNDVVIEVKKTPNDYLILAKLINTNVLEFDGYKSIKFNVVKPTIGNEVTFTNNSDKGINILSDFYNDVSLQQPITLSRTKPSSDAKININVLNETKLKSKTTKNIYQIIKTMYDKSIFSPTIFSYPKNSYLSEGIIAPSRIASLVFNTLSKTSQNKFNNFSWDFREFLDRNLYSENVYINDPVMSLYTQFISQISYWSQQGIYDQYNAIHDNEQQPQDKLNSIKKAQTNYKLMAYLNPWQQWVVMWTGNASSSVSGANDMAATMLLPINNYLDVKIDSVAFQTSDSKAKTNYFLMGDFNKPVTLTSLSGLYTCYLLVTLALAGLTLWWITRKDFV